MSRAGGAHVIGVGIPTYNRRAQLGDTLRSVLHQDCDAPTRVVVVDDGSSDGTLEWALDEFAAVAGRVDDQRAARVYAGRPDGSVHFIRQRNSGVARTHNTAIRALLADGCDYLTHIDTGDLALPHKHRVLSEYLSANPGTGLVHARSQDMSIEGFLFAEGTGPHESAYSRPRAGGSHWERAARGDFAAGELAASNYVHNQTTMYTAAALHAAGDDGWWPVGVRVYSDWGFYQTLERAGVRFGFVPEYVAVSRADTSGISGLRHAGDDLATVLARAATITDGLQRADAYAAARFGWRAEFDAWRASGDATDCDAVIRALHSQCDALAARGDYAGALSVSLRLDRLTGDDTTPPRAPSLINALVAQLRMDDPPLDVAKQLFALVPSCEHAETLAARLRRA